MTIKPIPYGWHQTKEAFSHYVKARLSQKRAANNNFDIPPDEDQPK